jgi:glycosyltransferase involved in cell wall biosynthesis
MAEITHAVPVIAEGLFTWRIGGSERVGVDLALEFKRRGYRVVCFAFHDSDGPMRTQLEAAGICCLDMNYEQFKGVFRRLAYLWRLWRMLRRERVTVLHVHHTHALILCGIPAWLAAVPKVVMTEHSLEWRNRPRARGWPRFYCRYANEITFVDPAQADYFLAELGVPEDRVHYVANGVRIPTRTPGRVGCMRQKLGIPTNELAFFFVGRLDPLKDLGTLLEAFAALPPAVLTRARLYLVGDGSERAKLQARRDELRLGDSVIFLGLRNDVSEILMAADVFVMSSISEGLPMALLEAIAAGVPCVATAVGGIPQLLGNDRGLVVPAKDPLELARAMASVAESAQLRARFAANAIEHLRKNHGLEAIADRYLELLGLPPIAVEAGTAG